jgi:hypothetical protein
MTKRERPALEIEQDDRFQRIERLIQRAGWVAMTAVIAAAAAGLLGNGPLSDRIAGEKGGPLWVEYQRFGRWQAPEEMRVHLGPGQAKGGHARVWLSRDFIEMVEIEHVTPQPEVVELRDNRVIYVFRAPSEQEGAEITFNVKPQHWGRKVGQIGLDGGPSFTLAEIVYP